MGNWAKQLVIRLLWFGVRRIVKAHEPHVIAITGSVGKTTTKEALVAMLRHAQLPLVYTAGNLNSEFGVPLSLLGFTEPPAGGGEWVTAGFRALFMKPVQFTKSPVYVLEYSADKPGDIEFLTKQIQPDVAVLTKIVPVHMAFYPEFSDLVKEKFALVRNRSDKGVAILNADDPVQVEQAAHAKRVIWYGVSSQPAGRIGVWARDIRVSEQGIRCTFDFHSGSRAGGISRVANHRRSVTLRVIGKQQVSSLLAAAAAGLECRLDPETICAGLETFEVPPGRGRVLEGKRGITIIDDSYNASPEAVKAGLDMAKDFAGERRCVAILGTMNELGEGAEAAHTDVARYAAKRVTELVLVGPYAEAMLQEAMRAGMVRERIITFERPEYLFEKLDQLVRKQDVVYVKASQNGMRLERAVERLLANPAEARHVLSRQSNYWKVRS